MRKLTLLAVLVLASCTARSEPEDVDGADSGATDWSAQLTAQAGSSIRGAANAQSVVVEGFAATTSAGISIAGATPGARHPWHVHSGTCASGGPIVGPASAYPVLSVRADGSASATANHGVGMDDEAAYHVNVHRSESDLGTIIACGNLAD